MRCLYLSGRVEADSGNKNNALFVNWHYPVYGSSACGIFMRLGDLEGKSIWCHVEELQFLILADNFFSSQPAPIKEGVATRACSANRFLSRENISVAGLVFGKGVCTFIASNSSMELYFLKEDVGLRVTDGIRKDFFGYLLGHGDSAISGYYNCSLICWRLGCLRQHNY